MRRFLWLMIGILCASPAMAQAPYAPPAAFPSFQAALTGLPPASDTASNRTYWLEGGLIGAAILGVTGYLVENAVANTACSDTGGQGCHDYRTAAIVGGAALGFLIGSLIGRGHIKAPN